MTNNGSHGTTRVCQTKHIDCYSWPHIHFQFRVECVFKMCGKSRSHDAIVFAGCTKWCGVAPIQSQNNETEHHKFGFILWKFAWKFNFIPNVFRYVSVAWGAKATVGIEGKMVRTKCEATHSHWIIHPFVSLTDEGIDRCNHNEYDEANNRMQRIKSD